LSSQHYIVSLETFRKRVCAAALLKAGLPDWLYADYSAILFFC